MKFTSADGSYVFLELPIADLVQPEDPLPGTSSQLISALPLQQTPTQVSKKRPAADEPSDARKRHVGQSPSSSIIALQREQNDLLRELIGIQRERLMVEKARLALEENRNFNF